jgi:drug/metabolite transporter (DMT)-like permease
MAYILLTMTVLFWSGNFVLGRGVHELIPPLTLAFYRWLGALVILLPFAWPHLVRDRQRIVRHWKLLALLALLSVTNFNTFIYLALNTTTVANTVLINSTMPIFIVVIAWWLLGERVSPRQGVGVALSLAGMLWIITKGSPASLLATRFTPGDLWTLAAALSWAVYTVLLRYRPPALHPMSLLTVIVAMGLLPLIPLYLWDLAAGRTVSASWPVAGSIAYVALFPSVLAYLFWNRAVGLVGPARAGIFIHLMPVFGIVLAALLLAEMPRGYHLEGVLMIFPGIFLTSYQRTAKDPETKP